MALSQLQGLNPLGGGGGYGMGRPPNGDGTDPNQPDDSQQQYRRRPQNTGAPSSSQGAPNYAPQGQQGPPRPTFAQMQQSGQARPAPPSMQGNGSPQAPYSAPVQGAPQGQQYQPQGQQQSQQGQQGAGNGVANALGYSVQGALQNPSAYGAPQVQQTFNMLNQQLGQQYQLQQKQLNEELASRGISDSSIAGQRYSDLATEQARAQANLATQLSTQAAQQFAADRATSQQAGLSYQNLGLQQAGLTGTLNGQQTLGAQQLGLQNQQFQQSLGLQSQLGLGNLGVAQQQANTQQAGTIGQLGLGQQQLGQQANQFGQSFGLQSLENQQQYGLSQQQLALQQAMGYGNLGIAQQQANTQQESVGNQYALGSGQLSLAQLANQQQYGISSQQLAQNQAYQSGQLGLGQQQINASLLNEQRQAMGNLAYAGLLNGQTPSTDWLNFLMSSQGQDAGSLYNLPSWAGSGQPTAPSNGGMPPGSSGRISGGSGLVGNPKMTPTYNWDPSQFTFSPSQTPQNPAQGAQSPSQNPSPGQPQSAPGAQGPGGLSPQLAAMFGYTTADGKTPLVGSQYMQPGQTQQQAASGYQQNALNSFQQAMNTGSLSLNTPGLNDQQFNQLLGQRYQSLLSANNGWQQGAVQALLNGPSGDVNRSDPRVQSFLQSLGGGR